MVGWVTTFKQKPLCRSFFSHYHSFSLVSKLRRGRTFKKSYYLRRVDAIKVDWAGVGIL